MYVAEFLGDCNLNQLVDVPTWSRTISGRVKESTLDLYPSLRDGSCLNPRRKRSITQLLNYYTDI